jgi:hypothetical protein
MINITVVINTFFGDLVFHKGNWEPISRYTGTPNGVPVSIKVESIPNNYINISGYNISTTRLNEKILQYKQLSYEVYYIELYIKNYRESIVRVGYINPQGKVNEVSFTANLLFSGRSILCTSVKKYLVKIIKR